MSLTVLLQVLLMGKSGMMNSTLRCVDVPPNLSFKRYDRERQDIHEVYDLVSALKSPLSLLYLL